MTTTSPTLTVWLDRMSVRETCPEAEPTTMPWALLDCTIAETLDDSSVSRRTVEDVAPHSTICPMTPLEAETGIPTESPSAVPLSMVTVDDQESAEPEMMRAAVDCRLYVSLMSRSCCSLVAVCSDSSSSAFLAWRRSFSALRSESVAWSAVRLAKMLPRPWKGAETVAPR